LTRRRRCAAAARTSGALLARFAIRAVFDMHCRGGERQLVELGAKDVSNFAASQQNSDPQNACHHSVFNSGRASAIATKSAQHSITLSFAAEANPLKIIIYYRHASNALSSRSR
jgi:hypothetical protein